MVKDAECQVLGGRVYGYALIFIILSAFGSGCICSQSSTSDSGQSPPVTTAADSGVTTATTVPVVGLKISSTPELGKFLVDGNGMTLYTYTKDEDGKSNCFGSCATSWPPLISEIEDTDDNLEGVVGVTVRSEGVYQVCFNGAPLYYYSGDKSPGDVKGQGVGGVWHVAYTSGQEITQETTSTTVVSTQTTEASGVSGIQFTTDPERDTYSLKDTFEPKVEVAPLNPEHNYTIVTYMHADGGSPSGGTDTQSMTGVESTTVWLHPFTNDETGYQSENEHFTKPGVHHFEISVYDCTVIEASTGVENCGRGKKVGVMEGWEFPDGMKNQQPDAKIDKAITVVGG